MEMSQSLNESISQSPNSSPYDCLRRSHVVEAVIGPDHDYVLDLTSGNWRPCRRLDFSVAAGQWNAEVIGFDLVIGNLVSRFHVLPIARIHGIFRTLQRREAIGCTEGDVNPAVALNHGGHVVYARGSGVHFEAAAFFFGGKCVPG